MSKLIILIAVTLLVLLCNGKKHENKSAKKGQETVNNLLSMWHKTHKIFGGKNAAPGSAPYQVSLRPKYNPFTHFCGGALLSKCHVLTASHCDYCLDANCVVAHGNNNLDKMGLLFVESYQQHEDYLLKMDEEKTKILDIHNDIAIIKLLESSYLTMDENTQTIDLFTGSMPHGESNRITGWGYMDKQATKPKDLQETTVKSKECPSNQKSWFNYICVTSDTSGACAGDSGGPLTYEGKLAGIASYASSCEYTPSNDGYTNVSYYIDWIRQKMEASPC